MTCKVFCDLVSFLLGLIFYHTPLTHCIPATLFLCSSNMQVFSLVLEPFVLAVLTGWGALFSQNILWLNPSPPQTSFKCYFSMRPVIYYPIISLQLVPYPAPYTVIPQPCFFSFFLSTITFKHST